MKKYLYGTTILAAVGLAAGPVAAEETPIHLELGGGYSQNFGFSDQDLGAGRGEVLTFVSHEVHFKIRGELPNGLKIGGAIELEGESGGDQIDQAYINLSGGFGLLRLGGINSGRNSMIIWSPDVGFGGDSGSQGTFMTVTTNSGGGTLSTSIDISGDSQKITYFTPRFNGFQVAASWAPIAGVQNGGNDPGLSTDATDYTDAWDLGASWKGDFDNISVSAMAGVGGADAPINATAAGFDDYLVWNLGLQLGFGGFTGAVGYMNIANGQYSSSTTEAAFGDPSAIGAAALATSIGGVTTVTSNEGNAIHAGVSYGSDPWAVSVGYFNGEEKGNVALAGDQDIITWAVGASYALGPGLNTSLTFLHTETNDQPAGGAGNNTGKALIAKISVGF